MLNALIETGYCNEQLSGGPAAQQYFFMMDRRYHPAVLARLAALALFFPACAWGALGGAAASVEADRQSMSGTLTTSANGGYTVYEFRTPSGTVVRQYLSAASGKVFGVAWDGPSLPDLRQILGEYFDQYVNAAKTQGAGPGAADAELPGLVVRSGGRMRAFFGQAYLPQMLPQGISPEAIR